MSETDRPQTIWIDVEDLFQYADQTSRPSGIQRIEYELCRALAALPESRDRVRFLRHSGENDFRTVAYRAIEDLFSGLVSEQQPAPQPHQTSNREGLPRGRAGALRTALHGLIRRLAYRLPVELRDPLLQAYAHQRAALSFVGRTGFAASKAARLRVRRLGTSRRGRPNVTSTPMVDRISRAFETAAPGDVLLTLGSPWFHPDYADMVRKAQREKGMRFGVLIYDLIPVRRPEWCDRHLVESFRSWHRAVLPLADILLTISNASRRDIALHARTDALKLRTVPQVITIGTGFSSVAEAGPDNLQPRDPLLPPVDSYALIVSTIEARKNHLLLFRVWRRLLEDMPLEDVPTLVIAGRIGWMVGDLMQQLRNADYLGGKIVLIEDPSDRALRQLYAGCLFTLFPSFYEGWGLPVTESLAFGKPCVISKASSLPEAGGALARYIDPDDLHDAYRVVRHAIEDKEGLQAWQATVKRDFRPVSWDTSAHSVLAGIKGSETIEDPVSQRA